MFRLQEDGAAPDAPADGSSVHGMGGVERAVAGERSPPTAGRLASGLVAQRPGLPFGFLRTPVRPGAYGRQQQARRIRRRDRRPQAWKQAIRSWATRSGGGPTMEAVLLLAQAAAVARAGCLADAAIGLDAARRTGGRGGRRARIRPSVPLRQRHRLSGPPASQPAPEDRSLPWPGSSPGPKAG
jgi:hypothetical protein